MASTTTVPPTMKALVLESLPEGASITLKTVPTPEVQLGSVIVKVLANHMYPGTVRKWTNRGDTDFVFTHPSPMIPGNYAVARVVAIGADATALSPGQLVIIEPFVRGRDNGDVQILWGAYDGPIPASKKLAADVWRDGLLAEYARTPLENTWAVNEALLCGSPANGGFGYSIPELTFMPLCCVAYGGLRGIDLKAGETIVVSPATGLFSMSAVAIATAMGAKVIAVSRNTERLKRLQEIFPKAKTVQPTGDTDKDTAAIMAHGPVDAFIDISPPEATGSGHLKSCINSVRQYGRISLNGGRGDPSIPLSYIVAVLKNLTIRGQYMYEREDVQGLIRLVESGALRIGKDAGIPVVGQFSLDDWEKGFEAAERDSVLADMVTLRPHIE
ncbi:hypothetical protein B0T25DRAFT_232401 [Lasiosphaeria hispida]|uniref:Alcohol dehydrogenase n=1 Tax=Lasiosphaeria hispida TaxID=260671 RepID=A0AAJ0HDT4_9PEZI|nr:hypothetical protein B0T25DRAFT_232401 [Lasiosphaeria hispida]